MGFNVGKFVKGTGKSIANRVVNDVVTAATSALPTITVTSANSTAQSLFNVGASFESISAFATQRTDAIVSDASADVYYALAGRDPARASAADIEQLRRPDTNNINLAAAELIPQTVIRNRKENKDGVDIIDASGT